MDAACGSQDPDLNNRDMEALLQEDACSFEFFQAVALIRRIHSDRKSVGRFSRPAEEAVHFRVNHRLAFPASQIQALDFHEGAPASMTVNFMGLTGPQGVLPFCYDELILEQMRAHDETIPDFFDIFNHRLISLFYRAWEKYHFPITYRLGEEDRFTQHLLDLVGLGTIGLQDRHSVPDDAFLHYVALLAEQSRSAAALEAIVSDYFEVPVEVEQFAGAWYPLSRASQCSMRQDDAVSDQLGRGAVVGDQVWNQQSKARIKLGPLTFQRYCEFLPAGSAFEPLRAITKFFSNGEFDFELQLILQQEEVPACDVGLEGDTGPRLGWVTWLKSQPFERNPGDTILQL